MHIIQRRGNWWVSGPSAPTKVGPPNPIRQPSYFSIVREG